MGFRESKAAQDVTTAAKLAPAGGGVGMLDSMGAFVDPASHITNAAAHLPGMLPATLTGAAVGVAAPFVYRAGKAILAHHALRKDQFKKKK